MTEEAGKAMSDMTETVKESASSAMEYSKGTFLSIFRSRRQRWRIHQGNLRRRCRERKGNVGLQQRKQTCRDQLLNDCYHLLIPTSYIYPISYFIYLYYQCLNLLVRTKQILMKNKQQR